MEASVWTVTLYVVVQSLSSHVAVGTLKMTPTEGQVTEGKSYTFTCTRQPPISSARLVIFKEGAATFCQLEPGPGRMAGVMGRECGAVAGQSSKFYFTLPRTYRNHSSTDWTCQAGGQISNRARLDVWYPPAVTQFTANDISNVSVVNINDTVTLHCRYEGQPPADVFIRKQSRSLQTVVDDVAVRSTLKTVSCHDMATYVCQASNRLGFAKSHIELFVRCPPSQGATQGRTTTSLEGDVTLTLTVMAYPAPTFTWFHPLGNIVDVNNGSLNADLSIISRITIKSVTADDLGVYKVTVKNDLGSNNFTVLLTRKEPVSGGLVTGLVIGGILLLAIIVVSVVLINRHSRDNDNDLEMDMVDSLDEDDANKNLYAEVNKKRKEVSGDSSPREDPSHENGRKTGVDEDGLLYVCVDVENRPDSDGVIHRTDDATQYADLTINQTGTRDTH
ncbi:tyrosine-protein kinase-like otk [Haliotis asinina]|uniref:tyrosine-protein kinase-like otk n=1 Tax=Haliotis asinina TaxID=109174 RepID=UPI00353248C0